VVIAPITDVVISTLGLPIPRPLLLTVGIVWLIYVTLLVLLGRIVDGMFVGLLVASTFSADIPLTEMAHTFSGHSVATALMFHGPLLGLLGGLYFLKSPAFDFQVPVYAFGAFVLATVLSAIFGGGPNKIAALWFSLYIFIGLLVYISTIFAVRYSSLSRRDAIFVFFLVVMTQATLGTLQLIRGQTFGFSELGEPVNLVVAELQFGVFSVPLGTHIAGFTGMSFQLSHLLILTFPLLIAAFIINDGTRRTLTGGIAVLFIFLIRGSSSDAARGAFLMGIISFGLLTYVVYQPSTSDITSQVDKRKQDIQSAILPAILTIGLLLYPSTGAGDSSSVSASSAATRSSGTTSGQGSAVSTGGGTSPTAVQVPAFLRPLYDTSIPLFDLSNLGVRLNQYLAAMEVFYNYPIFGLGGANFVLVGEQYGVTSPAHTELSYAVHSLYFNLLAETGLVGFSTFLITIALIYFHGVQGARSATSRTAKLAIVALLAGLSGSLSFMLLDKFLLTNAASWAQFWIVAAFTYALSE
jgi:hypothetical protein